MLKIEPTKSFAAPKNGLTKTNGNSSENDVSGETGEGGGGDFATVLENLTSKNEAQSKESDLPKAKESEKDFHSKLDQHPKNNQPVKTKEARSLEREDAAGAATARASAQTRMPIETEMSVPPARAILHIADLERIVSSIRMQTFDGNSQIVLTLKNSVCSGLRIKLTTDENHRVTAEFIAANEKVKTQIDARSGELSDLLRQRGIKLASLQTTVGAETSGDGDNQQNSRNFETSAISLGTAKRPEETTEEIPDVSETTSTYRV